MTSADAIHPRVKICGLTTVADLEAAAAAGADALGIIVDVPVETPREVSRDVAAELVAAAPPFATSVLVTMADSATEVFDLLDAVRPDAVQLHGGLPVDELTTVAAETTTIPAYDVDETDAIRHAADVADAILLDTVDDAGAGGTGRTHDWELARAHVAHLDVPVILAGGLDPDNVASAVEAVDPYGVDVATGVALETDPARKDHAAISEFIANARGRPEVTDAWSR